MAVQKRAQKCIYSQGSISCKTFVLSQVSASLKFLNVTDLFHFLVYIVISQ